MNNKSANTNESAESARSGCVLKRIWQKKFSYKISNELLIQTDKCHESWMRKFQVRKKVLNQEDLVVF